MHITKHVLILLALFVLSACVAKGGVLSSLPPDHPGSPDGAESTYAVPSKTLEIDKESHDAAPDTMAQEEHSSHGGKHQHRGHHGH